MKRLKTAPHAAFKPSLVHDAVRTNPFWKMVAHAQTEKPIVRISCHADSEQDSFVRCRESRSATPPMRTVAAYARALKVNQSDTPYPTNPTLSDIAQYYVRESHPE